MNVPIQAEATERVSSLPNGRVRSRSAVGVRPRRAMVSMWDGIVLVLLLAATVALRFVHLGYSDYQGDEIKALYLPAHGATLIDFLLSRRKGPGQYLVTAALKCIDPEYAHPFLIRAPFALAGCLAVYLFYRLVRLHFDKRVAIVAAWLMATNGFFVAFGRIVQYQSIVILFMILALYAFSFRRFCWGFLFWALSILSHYDGLFIAPFVIYLARDCRRNRRFWFAAAMGILLVAAFYIPFALVVDAETINYWRGRLSEKSSTRRLFEDYQPVLVLPAYVALTAVGLAGGLVAMLRRGSGPRLATGTNARGNDRAKWICLLAWFLLPFAFMEGVLAKPGTHIYNYLTPLFIFMGLAWVWVEDALRVCTPTAATAFRRVLGTSLLLLAFAQSYTIFVDHSREYPWEDKRFLLWSLDKPHCGSAIFGFPYNRRWGDIRSFLLAHPEVRYYSSNEKRAITDFYVPQVNALENDRFYIHIPRPQAAQRPIVERLTRRRLAALEPVRTFSDARGREVASIYALLTPHPDASPPDAKMGPGVIPARASTALRNQMAMKTGRQ